MTTTIAFLLGVAAFLAAAMALRSYRTPRGDPRFLEAADLVEYAMQTGQLDELRDALDAAENFMREDKHWMGP